MTVTDGIEALDRTPEHLSVDCWCGHPKEGHRWDPVRDYRELACAGCVALRRALSENAEDPA